MIEQCTNLDAYLADDLPVEAAESFVSHLPSCEECRAAIAEQRWIDQLLRSPVRLDVEPVLDRLMSSVRAAAAQQGHTRQRYAYFTAAAAVLFTALGWIVLRNGASVKPLGGEIVRDATKPSLKSPTVLPPSARFVSNLDVIAVPLASPAADVSIVQLYPTTATERLQRLESLLSNSSTSLNTNGG
jgi:hypothetical protein